MQTFLIVVHVFLALSIIVLVLMQHGKGASLGASFGAGAAASMFGPVGSSNLLSRTTAVLVAAFFTVSMLIAVHGKHQATEATQFLDEDLPALLESADETLSPDGVEGVIYESDDGLTVPPLE